MREVGLERVVDVATADNLHLFFAPQGRRSVVPRGHRAERVRAVRSSPRVNLVDRVNSWVVRVGALGSGLQGPWRAEEKAAATAAWMVLSR